MMNTHRLLSTQAEFVSWKLPLVVVRQVGGVKEGVVVSIRALYDFPTDLVPGLLRRRDRKMSCDPISTLFLLLITFSVSLSISSS